MLRIQPDANLIGVIAAFERATAETQNAMRDAAEAKIEGTWRAALLSKASTELEERIIVDGADSDVEGVGFALWAGIGGPVSGGYGSGAGDWAGVEYGMTPVQTYETKRRKTIRIAGSGREMKVATQIWVGKNLRPRNEDGYVGMPAVREHVPQYVASWVHGLIGVLAGVDGIDIVRG